MRPETDQSGYDLDQIARRRGPKPALGSTRPLTDDPYTAGVGLMSESLYKKVDAFTKARTQANRARR